MLIEGGYLHSLKALLEKAENGSTPKSAPHERPPMFGTAQSVAPRQGFGASLRKLRAKLLRKTVN